MRIVNRQAFLAMPVNTVFSKYTPCVMDAFNIKGDTIYDRDGKAFDYYEQQVSDSVKARSSSEFSDILLAAEQDGSSFALDFDGEGRDGLYDEGQLFAVWEEADVLYLIERLFRCVSSEAIIRIKEAQ